MKPGPVPAPTQDKIARGNPGKRSSEVDLTREAQPEIAIPDMPDYLDGPAQEVWKELSEMLFKNKLLTVADGAALGVLCQAISRLAKAEKELADQKLTIFGTKSIIKNPLLLIIENVSETILKYSQQFGMTPAARSRIKFPAGTFAPGGGKGEDPKEGDPDWEKFKNNRTLRGGKSPPPQV